MQYFLFILAVTPFLYFRNRYSYWSVVGVVTVLMAVRGNEDEYSRLLSSSVPLSSLFRSANFLIAEKGPLLSLVNGTVLQFNLHNQLIFLFYVPLQILIFAYATFRLTSSYNIAFFFGLCQSVLFTSMSGLRMGLTASLTLLTIYFIKRGRFRHAIAAVVASVANHYTALITPLVAFVSFKHTARTVAAICVLAILVANTPILAYIFGLFPQDPHESLVTSYLATSSYSYQLRGLDFIKAAQQIAVAFIVVRYRGRILENDAGDRALFGGYLLSTALLISFSSYAIFAYRLSAVFALTEPVLIGKIHTAFKNKLPFLRFVLVLISLMFAYLNYVVRLRVEPYSFIVS